ncbi:MAG: sugar phosphate nucleotidyltransferase [Patescibacteria group bacterium]
MIALILAGGFGTRLWPLTKQLPKALLRVGNQTLLERLLVDLDTVTGVRKTVIVSNGLYYEQLHQWVAGHPRATNTIVINNGVKCAEDRLGAVGDVAAAIRALSIKDDLFVAASDCFLTFSLKGFIDCFELRGGNWIAVKEEMDRSILRDGAVAVVDQNSCVTYVEEKPDTPRSSLGVYPFYIYERAVLPLFDVFLGEGNNPDSPGRFPEWLYTRRRISAYVCGGAYHCYDLGTRESYEEACSRIETGTNG